MGKQELWYTKETTAGEGGSGCCLYWIDECILPKGDYFMRTFNSYGPVNTKQHYYAPRLELIELAYRQLLGETPEEGGHYITVWAPRQTGKTWIMQEVLARFKTLDQFELAILTMQSAKAATKAIGIFQILAKQLSDWFQRPFPVVSEWRDLSILFSPPYVTRPLILILDEFDAMGEEFINHFANEFRTIYTGRNNQKDRKSGEKSCLLHGLALVGVRSVLGIENVTGSPFNVQRSVHIPNLTLAEVVGMFQWYERESQQTFEAGVIDRIYYEMRGQPGLTCWLGELLTQNYNRNQPVITMQGFEITYAAACHLLPNNNVLNLISKAKQEPYKGVIFELFRTNSKFFFRYDNPHTNYLYMNGIVAPEIEEPPQHYLKFASPFVQKLLFSYFAHELYGRLELRLTPFEDLSDTIDDQQLYLPNLLRRYERYLQQNRGWLLQDAPRRATDHHIFEAVFHFNLYYFLLRFLESYRGHVTPEFPTGNGKLDLLIRYAGQRYGIEVKSFVNLVEYQRSLTQTADYAHQLGLGEMTLALFIEAVDDDNRQRYEQPYTAPVTGVIVRPVFVVTG